MDERASVIDVIARLQLSHESMEFFGARPNQPLSTCIEQIRQSDIMLIIIGHMYGSIVPDLGISYSEAEYDEGYRLRKPCLPYFRPDDVPILPKFVESDPKKRRLLAKFREKIQSRHTVANFRGERDLSVQVSIDLGKLISKDNSDDLIYIVRKGKRVWNIWRMDNDTIHPDLANSDLSKLDLSGFDFSLANLLNANLRDTDLTSANFTGANLVQADLSFAMLDKTTFNNTTMSNAIIDKCIHIGKSFLDTSTLQKNDLPLIFLRGCGIADYVIDYLPSIFGKYIQYYSCFIAYSSKDFEFVERLHADLQNAGVRCWFAPHDLPLGAKTYDEIDSAIRLRDKLLVVISAAAVASDWVEDEVNHAFEEERQRKEIVLYPIRIDDAVFATSEPWAVKLRDQRNIGNFGDWSDYEKYQLSLQRLLRDLTTRKA